MAVIDCYQPPTTLNWKVLRAHGMDEESQNFRQNHGDDIITIDETLVRNLLDLFESSEETDRWAKLLLSDSQYDRFDEQMAKIDQRYRGIWHKRDEQIDANLSKLDKIFRRVTWLAFVLMMGVLVGGVVGYRFGLIQDSNTLVIITFASFLPLMLVFLLAFVVVIPLEAILHRKANPPARIADYTEAGMAEKELLVRGLFFR